MAQIGKVFNVLEAGLPSNPEAERFVLAQCMIDPVMIETACDAIVAEDFTTEAHRRIWEGLCAVHASGERVDRVMVAQWLMERGWIESVGGMGYMLDLEEGMPRVPNIEGYVRSLRTKTVKRKAMLKCNDLLTRLGTSDEDASEIFADAEATISKLTGELSERSTFRTPGEVVLDAGGIESYLRRRSEQGILSPWSKLNRMTGGFRPGNLIVLAARTGRGKTAMALNMAFHATMRGGCVALFSMEMDKAEITDRLLSIQGKFESRTLRRAEFDPEDEQNRRYRVREAIQASASLPLYINDRSSITTPGMLAELRKLRATRKIDMVVVDYLQLAKGAGKFGTRAEEVANIARGLKGIAMELGVPVIALSQFSRESSKDEREPELHDLKESSEIEQAADIVLMIHFTRMYDIISGVETGDVKLFIRKQRAGPVGWLPLQFHAPTGIFREIEEERREQ